ncbi:6-phosphogluconate dehydrogenase [Flavobacterium sp. TMP13]|uniref:6-phosphogluconate dehydrogenase n=1 Tax=unclassified Flavobacterium TaxID=196869 RepID=UPI00076C2350|nr:6-phosphogluconate dehydrogenase [Flavobacterium sp. TAB 87]KVV15356.1 hypothetical protein AP058_01022 [Flavobacterium sp. TAB 87]
MFRKVIIISVVVVIVSIVGYLAFINYVPYSNGMRSGELIKLSKSGAAFKTWEGELSQGISGAQVFRFSVQSGDTELIEKLQGLQGHYVVLSYVEKYQVFPWWGDTRFFIVSAKEEVSPFKIK